MSFQPIVTSRVSMGPVPHRKFARAMKGTLDPVVKKVCLQAIYLYFYRNVDKVSIVILIVFTYIFSIV